MNKAVILAGGTGSRLSPITRIINKHLLPVGNYPMIYWSIYKVREAGIEEILLLTSREYLSLFIQLLGEGEEFNVKIKYKIQESATGIAGALSLAKDFIGDEKFLVLLGDNIFQDSLQPYLYEFEDNRSGAFVLLKEVEQPEHYGIARFNKDKGEIISIVEKPKEEGPAYCVTGIYFYDPSVFSYIERISPSTRGELEITDVNNFYLNDSLLSYEVLKGWWIDAGTPESLFLANKFVHKGDGK
ncbi:sugar phosphate nucleotidyltransferase [Bacillus sp. FJAT-45350]|uniref:sugar phosphate nucleotidyltransferase n=1 Tax=Bacillus sp. FJAT-45350 TaxID=2011014 RepID=UPI000BB6DE8B|nr:sugar phosphate nucleotidyltransferase [Bacillus sp. FJAT-45350]